MNAASFIAVRFASPAEAAEPPHSGAAGRGPVFSDSAAAELITALIAVSIRRPRHGRGTVGGTVAAP